MVFRASFDDSTTADIGKGDKRIYTAESLERMQPKSVSRPTRSAGKRRRENAAVLCILCLRRKSWSTSRVKGTCRIASRALEAPFRYG